MIYTIFKYGMPLYIVLHTDLNLVACLGILLIIVGNGAKLFLRKQRFDRRSETGMENFSSFSSAYFTSKGESDVNIFGTLMKIAGYFLILVELIIVLKF